MASPATVLRPRRGILPLTSPLTNERLFRHRAYLAWGLLFKLMPREHRGAIAGLATTTKGVGLLLGAPLAEVAIDLARPYLSATDGYAVLWPLCGIPILAVIPLVAHLMRIEAAAATGTAAPGS